MLLRLPTGPVRLPRSSCTVRRGSSPVGTSRLEVLDAFHYDVLIIIVAVSFLRCDDHGKLNIIIFITLVKKQCMQKHFSGGMTATMIFLEE